MSTAAAGMRAATPSASHATAAVLPVILYVSAVADRKGGAETVLLDMLRNPAIRPLLAVPDEGDLAAAARRLGVQVVRFELGAVARVRRPVAAADAWRAARDTLRAARQLAALARTSGAAIVHTNGLKVHMVGCLARLLHGTPVLVHQHDVPYSAAEQAIWSLYMLAAWRTIAGHEICLPGALPGLARRAGVVMQGISEAAPAASRRLPSRPVLGFVGRVHPFKGVHLLLEWFEVAAQRHPEISLLLRGQVSDEGAAYWAGLRPRFERLAAAGRCRIEGWRPVGEDPFEGIDILLAPSAMPEVGPRVVMEAMLRGIPAIGALAGGALRMIPSAEVGGKAADLPTFLTELERLLDPEAYAGTSAAALLHARREFGVERFWRDLSREYEALLGRRMNTAA